MADLCLTGHFLIAMPSSSIDIFEGSLIYVVDHTKEGATGLIVNQVSTIPFSTVFQEIKSSAEGDEALNILEPLVYFGGPVSLDNGFILHSNERRYRATIGNAELLMTSSKDVLVEYLEGTGPSLFLFAFGYAGWGAGQLESEISRNVWLSVKADINIIFRCPVSERYQRAIKLLGVDPSFLQTSAGHA